MHAWPWDAAGARAWADGSLAAARAARERIDAVNVFPVPDADTGTNVALTLAGGAAAVHLLDPAASVAGVCGALADGASRAARGNSGIILGQWLRGFAAGLDGDGSRARTAPQRLAAALGLAADAARRAVPDPRDGTVLTVAREVADRVARSDGPDAARALIRALAAAREGLARTSAALDVLRDARVVDAGACALLVVLDVLAHVLREGRAPRPDELDLAWLPAPGTAAVPGGAGVTGGAFEVMLLVRPDDQPVDQPDDHPAHHRAGDRADDAGVEDDLALALARVGDSVAVADAGALRHGHVHTDDPAAALAVVPDRRVVQAVVRRLDLPPADPGLVVVTPSPGMAAWFATAGAVTVVRGSGAVVDGLDEQVGRAAADTHAASVVVVGVDVPAGLGPVTADGVRLDLLPVPDDGTAAVACLALLAGGRDHGGAAAREALARLHATSSSAEQESSQETGQETSHEAGRDARRDGGPGARTVAAAVVAAVRRLRAANPEGQAVTLLHGTGWTAADAAAAVRELERDGLDVALAGPAVGAAWWAGLD
ncbi:DAK2 domain-containing protein [Cellulomonas oligotrophica]|uniref:DAK2 domain-containing protein n=1 Tax=Cellulomonas oligotrophica TaxID=931536 RepID=UPI0031EAF069